MFKCISKQDTKYAELLVNAGEGGKYDPSAPKKSHLESGLYELHVLMNFNKSTFLLLLLLVIYPTN